MISTTVIKLSTMSSNYALGITHSYIIKQYGIASGTVASSANTETETDLMTFLNTFYTLVQGIGYYRNTHLSFATKAKGLLR